MQVWEHRLAGVAFAERQRTGVRPQYERTHKLLRHRPNLDSARFITPEDLVANLIADQPADVSSQLSYGREWRSRNHCLVEREKAQLMLDDLAEVKQVDNIRRALNSIPESRLTGGHRNFGRSQSGTHPKESLGHVTAFRRQRAVIPPAQAIGLGCARDEQAETKDGLSFGRGDKLGSCTG